MHSEYDLVILGAGVIGSSIAFHVSETNATESVLVIDKAFPLSGTSGATQSNVIIQSKRPAWYAQLSRQSSDMYPDLEKRIGDVEFRRTGRFDPFFTLDERRAAVQLSEDQETVGIKVDVLDKEEAREREPLLSPEIEGAKFCSLDAKLNPFMLLTQYIEKAREQGVTFSFYNPVLNIEEDRGGFAITSEMGVYRAKRLVLAAGPWTNELGHLMGVDIPVRQVRGQILVTEPQLSYFNHTIKGIKQLDNGVIVLTQSNEDAGSDRRTNLDVIEQTAQGAIRKVPALADVNIIRSFAGIRPVPEDGIPILGRLPTVRNAYVAVTHSGFTLSPMVGTFMAELLNEGSSGAVMEEMSMERFA